MDNKSQSISAIVTHISWMAHHKQVVYNCIEITCIECSNADYDSNPYFQSFHEIVHNIKSFQEEERRNTLNECFIQAMLTYPNMAQWIEHVKSDHFEANENIHDIWPFWHTEFLYIAKLDRLLEDDNFAKEFYNREPDFYFGRCPCQDCGIKWNLESTKRKRHLKFSLLSGRIDEFSDRNELKNDRKESLRDSLNMSSIIQVDTLIYGGKKYFKDVDGSVYHPYTYNKIGNWDNTTKQIRINHSDIVSIVENM